MQCGMWHVANGVGYWVKYISCYDRSRLFAITTTSHNDEPSIFSNIFQYCIELWTNHAWWKMFHGFMAINVVHWISFHFTCSIQSWREGNQTNQICSKEERKFQIVCMSYSKTLSVELNTIRLEIIVNRWHLERLKPHTFYVAQVTVVYGMCAKQNTSINSRIRTAKILTSTTRPAAAAAVHQQ